VDQVLRCEDGRIQEVKERNPVPEPAA
jgi:hypothetical protein